MKFADALAPYVHWGLRLALAGTFIYHGLAKFPPDGFAQAMGFPLVLGWGVAVAEVAAGVLLIIGGVTRDELTRIGGLIVIVVMLGAIGLVHWENGWDVQNGSMEFQVLMLTTGLYFLARGNRS